MGKTFKMNNKMDDVHFTIIDKSGKIVNGGNLFFKNLGNFYHNYAILRNTKNEYNYINKNGEVISPNMWFRSCDIVGTYYPIVSALDEKTGKQLFNFLNLKTKKIVSPNMWFHSCADFNEGYAAITVEDQSELKYNWIDEDGNLLSKDWYFTCHSFKNGFAKILRKGDNPANFIDKNGSIISTQWFYLAKDFSPYGYALVAKKESRIYPLSYNFVDGTGKLINDEWFKDAKDFEDGVAQVTLKTGEIKYISVNGNIFNSSIDAIRDEQKISEKITQ